MKTLIELKRKSFTLDLDNEREFIEKILVSEMRNSKKDHIVLTKVSESMRCELKEAGFRVIETPFCWKIYWS